MPGHWQILNTQDPSAIAQDDKKRTDLSLTTVMSMDGLYSAKSQDGGAVIPIDAMYAENT